MKYYNKSDLQRFWDKIDVCGPGECWNWLAGTVMGYGTFNVHDDEKGKLRQNGNRSMILMKAARFMYWITTGIYPVFEMKVWHSCGNRLCVNPDHLWLGTQKKGIQDAARKGLMARRWTEKEVREIRAKYEAGATTYDLATMYDMLQSSVWVIIKRKTWTHI